MSAGHRTQFDLVEDFWQELVAVDERLLERARRTAARHRTRRMLLFAVLSLLAAAAIALAAGLFERGEDAPPQLPGTRVYVLDRLPGTLQIVPTTAADPDGGPPWGMRLFRTKTEVCFQIGRLVDGKLVILGIGGAFGNDRRYHALPLEPEGCAGYRTDRAFVFSNGGEYYASGLSLDNCSQRTVVKLLAKIACDPGTARTVLAGSGGHHVVAVTLRTAGTVQTQRVVDRKYGTYLFVLRGAPRERGSVRARYDDGHVCPLPSRYDFVTRPHVSYACLRQRARP